MPMKLALGAGHGGNDPGAVSGDNVEANLARSIVTALGNRLSYGYDIVWCTVDEGYPNNINKPVAIANDNGCELAIQLHFNAGGGTGVEVLHWYQDVWGAELAHKLSAAIAGAAGLANRGAKPRGEDLGFLRDTNMTSLIIEFGFVDAPGNTDVPAIFNNFDAVIEACAIALGCAPLDVQTPVDPTEPDELAAYHELKDFMVGFAAKYWSN